MSCSRKRKRTLVSIEKKVEALRRIDSGESVKSISSDFGVGESTVGEWKKKRNEIEDYATKIISQGISPSRMTLKSSANEDVEEALFMWFSHQRDIGMPVSGPILQAKALQFYNAMKNDEKFKASKGWLDKFKKRYGIHHLSIQGESLSADHSAAQRYKVSFEKIIKEKDLKPEQVYNADETGLYYKLLPSKTLISRLEKKAPGYKKSKERVTILACSNASGSHKLPLLLIGKSKNPRAFKHVNRNALPCKYTYSKTAWMTSSLFRDWFYEYFVPDVTEFLKNEGLPARAVLLIDNAPSHPGNGNLRSGDIEVIFLPPNVTSILQPMDQGVLETVKRNYKQSLLLNLLSHENNNVITALRTINIKDVVYMSANAWDKVQRHTIIKSWFKLWKREISVPEESTVDEANKEILKLVKNIEGCEEADEQDVLEWLSENEMITELSDADIVRAVQTESDDEQTLENEQINHEEGASVLKRALQYMEQREDTPAEVLLMLRGCHEKALLSAKLKK